MTFLLHIVAGSRRQAVDKRLEFDRPLQAFMTGLRVDAVGMPFDLASEPRKI